MSVVDRLAKTGGIGAVDLHAARLLARLADPAHAEVLALTTALLGQERANGHSCIDLGEWAGQPFPTASPAAADEHVRLPELVDWRATVTASALVGDGAEVTPIVDDGRGRLYLYRYWQAERRVAESLRTRAGGEVAAGARDDVDALFSRLFPSAAGADDHAAAAAAALASPLCVISGGPGTGKTTTVTRILALLLAAAPDLRAGVAAPTGKAAARLAQSLVAERARLDIDERLRVRIPTAAATIHRLLGARPRTGGFRHHRGRRLPLDVLVVDEASMIDLLLMDALLAATDADTRVILLGDKDQLASVETGFVFGDVCRAREALPRGCVVELRTSYRFGADSALGRLAAAVRAGDPAAVLEAVEDDRHEELRLAPVPADPAGAVRPLAAEIESVVASRSASDALARLAGFRILCATRVGPLGAESMSRAVERLLGDRGHSTTARFYRGRPIMITANDYQVGLFNGDVGVCWPRAEDGTMCAFFERHEGDEVEVRAVALARLPAHQTAWAMTVHKAQGSEFDHVVLVLGDDDARSCTRELLYTGVTRARRRVEIVASTSALRACVERPSARRSGLLDRLTEEPA